MKSQQSKLQTQVDRFRQRMKKKISKSRFFPAHDSPESLSQIYQQEFRSLKQRYEALLREKDIMIASLEDVLKDNAAIKVPESVTSAMDLTTQERVKRARCAEEDENPSTPTKRARCVVPLSDKDGALNQLHQNQSRLHESQLSLSAHIHSLETEDLQREIAEKDRQIVEKDRQIAEKNREIAEKNTAMERLVELGLIESVFKDGEIDTLRDEVEKLKAENLELQRENQSFTDYLPRIDMLGMMGDNVSQRMPDIPSESMPHAGVSMDFTPESTAQRHPETPIDRVHGEFEEREPHVALSWVTKHTQESISSTFVPKVSRKRNKMTRSDRETCIIGLQFASHVMRSSGSRYNTRSTCGHKYNLRSCKSNIKPY